MCSTTEIFCTVTYIFRILVGEIKLFNFIHGCVTANTIPRFTRNSAPLWARGQGPSPQGFGNLYICIFYKYIQIYQAQNLDFSFYSFQQFTEFSPYFNQMQNQLKHKYGYKGVIKLSTGPKLEHCQESIKLVTSARVLTIYRGSVRTCKRSGPSAA